jgi:hypothetical protein
MPILSGDINDLRIPILLISSLHSEGLFFLTLTRGLQTAFPALDRPSSGLVCIERCREGFLAAFSLQETGLL